MARDEAGLRDVQARRFQAMIEGDSQALASMLAEDLVYTHTTGAVDTKAAFLDHQVSGILRYEAIEPEEALARTYGDAGVITGTARMRVRVRDDRLAFRIRYTDVYARTDQGWKLVAWQSTRLPEDRD